MSTTALPPPSSSHIQDRYLFRSLSNDNQNSRISSSRKNKLSNNPTSSTTPPSLKKRYKFPTVSTDQNNNNVYKFPNGQTEPRSHSTDSDRYYFSPDESIKKPQQTLTYVRSGSGLEQRAVTFIDGTSVTTDKISSPTKSIQPTTIIPDTPYLFSKTTESQRHPSATSSVNPEDAWIHQRQQPHLVFDSNTDPSPTSKLKRPRTSSMSPDPRHITKRSPTRMDTVTSTNGSLSTLRQSPSTKVQNVRFDSSSTPRSYLNEARERLAGKQRGRSPQAFQQSVNRLVKSTNQKLLQQQILSPPLSFQHQPQHDYISQYYAQEEDEPPVDYPMDSDDDDEPLKRSYIYTRGLNTNRTHTQIMKNVNKSLIDRNYLSDTNRSRQLEQNVNRYLRFIENQSLQRELNHDLIRCFSSTYLDDLRREENRNFQTRLNMRSYTFEDIQDIHMSPALEAYKMKKAIDRERRLRLSTSFDGQITSSTPTSSIGAGLLSPLLSTYSPGMTGSLNENIDAQSGGFELDRRSQKSHMTTSQTPTSLRPGQVTPGPNVDLFYEIIQDRFRHVDESIAGHVSNASQYTKQKSDRSTTISPVKPVDHDSDVDIKSNSSFWSDEDDEQMIVDNQRQIIPHQKQLSRYLSTVNRSLLDRPSDLIADFYISQLNRSMQESVRHVETIARDKALMRQNRNREFIDEPTNKLGRSLSAEHLYQVRKEHLRYKQPFTTPTSFTVEDVADIYKPFVLENYKRKIAIELERRRRERQGQLMAGMTSPPLYTTDTDLPHVIKSTHPPRIEPSTTDRTSNLTRTRIVRTNEPSTQSFEGGQPPIQTKEVVISRARRTLTDDGSADVVHHIGIVSPPPSFSIVKRPSTQIRTNIATSTTDKYQLPQVSTVDPPDFADRNQVFIRKKRLQSNIAQPDTDSLIEAPLTTTQQILIKDDDYELNLRQPVQIITTQAEIITSRRPQAKIYTSSPILETVEICKADRTETDSGNYDLSMVNIKPIVTLNQGEIRELNFLAQEAQRLQIPRQDYDHAMIILTPEQTQYQHNIDQQPLLLAAANIDHLIDEQNERVTHHIDQPIQPQHTQLITPIAEHMAKVEQDIPVFENITSTNITQVQRNKLNEVPQDSGIVSLNTSQASEQPIILNASRINRLETSDEQRLENLHEDDYYRKRIRALDLLRHVETDPNANIQPVHNVPIEIFENTTNIPSSNIPFQHTNIIRNNTNQFNQIQTLEHTDEPVIYESIDQNIIREVPRREHLTSSDNNQDNQTTYRAEENQVQWRQTQPRQQYQPTQNLLSSIIYEQTQSLIDDRYDPTERVRTSEQTTQRLETPKQPEQNVVYNYGEKNEVPLYQTTSIDSDRDLRQTPLNSARVEYDRHSLSSLDDITQPVSYHPPVQTNRDQQHIATDIDVEPMAVREETAFENEVSYDGSFGRASFNQPIQPLNAPRTEYIQHEAKEVTILPNPSLESTPLYPSHSSFDRTEKARQSTESYNLERLPEHKYVEINITTPTPSMRKVRPSYPGPYTEDLIMENTVDARTEQQQPQQHARYRSTSDEKDDLHYASAVSREQSEHLPPKHLPVEYTPDIERAHVVPISPISFSDLNKNDEVLIRDTVVQHVSEDEKSTSSEEVVFEEWSEHFKCRRTDEFDKNTNRLLRTTIDETSARVKSDVIKEEYKEKNERIKGHKSYDIVKEVYRRVPAHTVDPTRSTIVSIDHPQSHLYEEIPQPPPSTISTTSILDRQLPIEHTPRDRHWSSEDIYTTEIVYDSKLARDIEASTHGERVNTRFDSISPPSSTANYDRVRPGQYPPIPTTSQVIISTVPSSNYDRISSIVTPSTRFSDRRQQERDEVVSEEYHVEVEQNQSNRRSPSNQRQTFTIGTKQQRDETSEEDVSDSYAITGGNTGGSYGGLTTIINEAGRRRDSDWRSKLKEVYTPTSDDDRYDQSNRSREVTKRVISTSRTDDDRPQPPKRSSSSSSIIDERRSRFEQQQIDSTSGLTTNITDRPTFGRVGELKNAFETTSGTSRDELSKYKTPVSTSLTEQRRRMFEDQEQTTKEWTPTNRRSSDEFNSNERRMSETHTAPSLVTERISRIENNESKSTSRIQPTDRIGRTGFDAIKSSLESSITKTTDITPAPQTSVDITIKDKRIISSIDSDLSGSSPPIYQSTPKSTKQKHDEDAGHESEDELSDPTNKQEQYQDSRRRTPKTRLRDFSQSTSQPLDATYLSQRTKSSFNESTMENILSHVPTSKGKGLLIELSPHISHETPITSTITTKPNRDPHKSIIGSDSGIFEYSTATSHHPPTSSLSWRNNASSSMIDDANRTPPTRDSGVYVDSATTISSRYGRRQASDTDQTTIHGGDDSVSRSTYKYDTEIISADQLNQHQQPRNIRRQITGSPPSDYENIANYHSGISSQRKVPITTQSRSILTKPLIVDEIETIETETRVECQVQRTHEIKESTTKTEQAGSPNAPKKIITTTTTTTTTTAAPTIRSPESSSDEAIRTTTPSRRVLLNERPQYYDSIKSTGSPITIRSPPQSVYTPTNETRQQTQTYRESGIHQHRYDSPQSDSISYPLPPTSTTKIRQEQDLIRIEETGFKPIQRDRSHDSLLQSPSSRSNVRTLSAGPRSVEITSLSPQNQVTFGNYTPNEIIAIVRVPELSKNGNARQSPSSPPSSTIRHGTSEPELYRRAKQEEEEQQQRSRLHYQRVHAASYRPPPQQQQQPINQEYQQRQARSRTGPYDTTNEYSSPLGAHTRSSSYHSVLHEQDRQQQQDQYSQSPNSSSAHRRQVQRRTGSLGNLFGSNLEFEIEIEKRPPQQPEQPTVVALDQATRAIVTTSKDGRVSIQNIAARPGNTVVINSDFHASDRSLNRSSGYFSSDELRSQGINVNYSSDEQSSGAGINPNLNSQLTHTRRYKNNEQNISKLPSHYRPKQQNNNYQTLNNESFDRVNQIVHRHYRQSNNPAGFNDTIDQIDALYNNLDVQANEDYHHDRFQSQQGNNNSPSTYNFSKSPSTANRRKNLSQNTNEYSKRYSSTGFQHIPAEYEQQGSTVRHLVSPSITSNNDKRRNDTHRAFSDNENLNNINEHNRNWGSSSLNDLVMATPIRPSHSLSSSGILADYGTPGSISPNSGFGSTQNVILQQNRLNAQQQIVQRNRTSVKQVKQKSAAKKKSGNIQGQYSDEEDENDSAGDHDSPLSDNGRIQPPPTRFANRHQ